MLPFTRAMLIHGSNFREHFFKKNHARKIPVKLFQNWTSGFREEDFFKEFFHVRTLQEASIHQNHVYGRIKISRTIFLKGSPKEHSCEIISKLDQRFFIEFLHVRTVQKVSPPMAAMFFDGPKFR